MDTRSPSWSRSSKSGANRPSGIEAPSKVLSSATGSGSSPRLVASTIAPRASTPTRSSARATRGFTRRRLESELVALPLHPPSPAHDVLGARDLEADASVQRARRAQVAEGEQLQALVAGGSGRLEDRVHEPAARPAPTRLGEQDEMAELAQREGLLVQGDRPQRAGTRAGEPEA